MLLATGPEFLAGSTRMTAGTAQKIALNLFSTQTMMALGRVYQGFMVDVVPTNAKLVARAKGIVQALDRLRRQPKPQRSGSAPAAISSSRCCSPTAWGSRRPRRGSRPQAATSGRARTDDGR